MIRKENAINFMLFLVGIFVLVPFIKTGVATGDDTEFFIAGVNGDIFSAREEYARLAGRFYFNVTLPFYKLPYLFNNLLLVKAINVIFIALGGVLLGGILKQITKCKYSGALTILLFLTFLMVVGKSSPVVSYLWYFSLSFDMILLSIFLLLKYREEHKRSLFWIALSLYSIGLLFYEVYMLYLPIIILLAINFNDLTKQRSFFLKIKLFIRQTWPVITVGAIYILLYVGYRVIYPAQYDGTTIAEDFKLINSFETISRLSKGAYPFFFLSASKSVYYQGSEMVFNHFSTVEEFVKTIKVEWFVKACMSSALAYVILNSIKVTFTKKHILIALICVAYMYLPNGPLGFTYKYAYQYTFIKHYITTYFCFFSFVALIGLLFSFSTLIKIKWLKKVIIILITAFICIGSLLNDYMNSMALKDLRQPLDMLNCVDMFIETEAYELMPEKSLVYAPNLHKNSLIAKNYSQGFNWGQYAYSKTGKRLSFLKNEEALLKLDTADSRSLYYLKYQYSKKNHEQLMAIGELTSRVFYDVTPDNLMSDVVDCFYYSDNKEFTLSFGLIPNVHTPYKCTVNGVEFVSPLPNFNIVCRYFDFGNNFEPIIIKGEGVDIESIHISPLATGKKVDLVIYKSK